MDTKAKSALLEVKIYAPFKIYFAGEANSLSAINATGPFDILPGHKNFISLLSPCTIRIRRVGSEGFNLDIKRGVIHVRSNKVAVFLDV